MKSLSLLDAGTYLPPTALPYLMSEIEAKEKDFFYLPHSIEFHYRFFSGYIWHRRFG